MEGGDKKRGEQMLSPALGVRELGFSEGRLALELTGRLDFNSAPAARAWLSERFKALAPRRVALGMGQVEFMDSEGLSVLVSLVKLCNDGASQLTLVRPGKSIGNLIRQTRLDRVIQIEE